MIIIVNNQCLLNFKTVLYQKHKINVNYIHTIRFVCPINYQFLLSRKKIDESIQNNNYNSTNHLFFSY